MHGTGVMELMHRTSCTCRNQEAGLAFVALVTAAPEDKPYYKMHYADLLDLERALLAQQGTMRAKPGGEWAPACLLRYI